MLKSLKTYFFNRAKLKKLKKFTAKRRTVMLKDAKKIGILFEAGNSANSDAVIKYSKELEKIGKKVQALGYFNQKKVEEKTSFDYFFQKDLHWNFQPYGNTVDKFLDKEFDILICAYLTDLHPFNWMSTFSMAKMRVGFYNLENTDCFDMMIKLGDNKATVENLLTESDRYLKMINSNENAA